MTGRASFVFCLTWGIALPLFVAPGSVAGEMDHVRKQTLSMQAIERISDPDVTGSVSGQDELVWIDVTRPTMCNP